METIIYRTQEDMPHSISPGARDYDRHDEVSGTLRAARQLAPVSPELFYPVVSAPEMTMWTYWLPTIMTFEVTPGQFPTAVLDRLVTLHAPPQVVEECRWACNLELFEAYAVRSPERQDVRDPLLLGRLGGQHYRIALWGESLRPLPEIADIVQQSLRLRRRLVRWRIAYMAAGVLSGVGVCWWLNSQASHRFWLWVSSQGTAVGDLIALTLVLVSLCLCFVWLPFLYTPENRQQDFLDRYRS